MRSWRSFLVMAGVALVPLSVAATDKTTDFLWEGSQLHFTPAALSAEELATAQVSTTTSSGQKRVSVGPRDTLWSIARTNRPSRTITIKQAMLAIRDANPSAFPTGNINEMEAGSSLIIPSAAAMRSRTAQQAEEAVRRQNQAWVASRTPQAAQETRSRTAAQPDRPEAVVPVETARDLQLTRGQETDEQQALIEELETRLEQSEDSLHSVEREKDELASRLSEMQEQLDTLQQLLRLKDEQLDELETQLAEGLAAQPASQLAPRQPQATQPDDLMTLLQRQPLILAILVGLLLILFLLLLVLLSTRRKLTQQIKDQAEADEARRREEELHSLMDSNAQPDDFDRDLNARPLDGLDDFEEDLDLDLDLGEDFAESEKVPVPPPVAAKETKKERDPLQEAEMFIAYGRLEQAAGFLHKALANSPEREDLRVKLLEVLVELNDEDTFEQQKRQLEAQNPSAESRKRAEELSQLLKKSAAAAAGAATAGAAASVAASEEAEAEDLGEMEFPDEDLDDLDDIFGSEETSVDELPEDISLEGLDEFTDLDDLEAELDEVLTEKPPLEPSNEEDLQDDLSDLEELADDEAEDLDLELDLEKPLADEELTEDESDLQDFEPVDYKSDADDFMSALDEINLDASDEAPHEELEGQEQVRSPGVDEEMSSLTDDLSELSQNNESLQSDDDWGDLDDLADLDSLELGGLDEPQEPLVSDEVPADDDLSSLDDLADLGDDLDFGDNDGDMNTQLDLATAYIEMGDKDGAREILEKVANEGDADQQATARQMLESLSS